MIECALESIKRSKEENIKIYNQNEIYLSKRLSENTKKCVEDSIIYDYCPAVKEIRFQKSLPSIEVVKTTSLIAASDFESAAILNFASGTRVGGGYVKGSNAQEECLCRSSNLYNVLKEKGTFYDFNRKLKGGLSSDLMIYSPSVTFFRDDFGNLMNDEKHFNIITAAAPNCRDINYSAEVLRDVFLRRIEKVLKIAIYNGNRNIILGAWGCGAFKCDANIVAECFKVLTSYYGTHFDNIIFAIVDSRTEELLSTFKRIIKG